MKILDIPQSGKRGLTVSQNGRYGQISRTYVVPANPQTPGQMTVRETFASIARSWDTLTEAQRLAWNAAAATKRTKPRCGTSGPMTGLQYYLQINANLKLLGQSAVDAPPATPVFPDLAPQNLVITLVGGVPKLALTCPTAPDQNTVIEACAPTRPGTTKPGSYRILGTCPAVVQGSSDISALYAAKFGAPGVGTKVYVRAHIMLSGIASVPRSFNAIVPAA